MRFFQILAAVSERVSSPDNGSGAVGLSGKAGLDKLCFTLTTPIHRDVFLANVRGQDMGFKETRLRDRRWYVQIGSQGTYLKGHLGSETFDYIVSRPSAFPSLEVYLDHLRLLLGSNVLENMKFRRIDFAVDYPLPLDEFLRNFDVARKRVRVAFTEDGSVRTGLLVGRGHEKILVYDKARESGTEGPLTRLEAQVSGSKLPARDLPSLRDQVSRGELCPFRSVRLAEIELPEKDELPTSALRDRIGELSVLLKHEGYLAARNKLQRDGNFDRDYGRYLRERPWTPTPDEAVQACLRSWLQKPV